MSHSKTTSSRFFSVLDLAVLRVRPPGPGGRAPEVTLILEMRHESLMGNVDLWRHLPGGRPGGRGVTFTVTWGFAPRPPGVFRPPDRPPGCWSCDSQLGHPEDTPEDVIVVRPPGLSSGFLVCSESKQFPWANEHSHLYHPSSWEVNVAWTNMKLWPVFVV